MWFNVIVVCITLHIGGVPCSQSANTIDQNLLSGLQIITNSSLNGSLMENQLPEQTSLSNTSLLDLQNDNNTQQIQLRVRER